MRRPAIVMVPLLLVLQALPGIPLHSYAHATDAARLDEAAQAREARIKDAVTRWDGDTPRLLEAQAELQRMPKTSPGDAWAYTQLAEIEYRLGYISWERYDPDALERAQALLSQALTLDPRHFDAHLTATYLALYQGHYERALHLIARAKDLEPNSPLVPLVLAHIDRRRGELDGALAQYRGLIAAHPDHARARYEAYVSMALIHRQRQAWPEQEAAFLAALHLRPESAWAKSNYAGALLASGKFEQAIEYARAALQQMDYGAARMVLAQAYVQKGWNLYRRRKFDEALESLEASVHAHPYYFGSYVGFGALFVAKSRAAKDHDEALDLLDQAERAYRHALTLSPDEPAVRDALGRTLAERERRRQAR